MKKLFALLTAFAVWTCPLNVFAASEYSITRVLSVAENYLFNNLTTTPSLSITLKDDMKQGEVFRIYISNASFDDADGDFIWNYRYSSDGDKTRGGTSSNGAFVYEANDVYEFNSSFNPEVSIDGDRNAASLLNQYFTVKRFTYDCVEFTAKTDVPAGQRFYIPLYSHVQRTGDLRVSVDPRDSSLSRMSEEDFGAVNSSDTAVKITASTAASLRYDSFEELPDIHIEESYAGALQINRNSSKTLKITAPSGYEFDNPRNRIDISLFGGLRSANSGWDDYSASLSSNRRSIEIDLSDISASQSSGSMTIAGIRLMALSGAKEGDVYLDISGLNRDMTEVKVATLKDYGFSFKVADEDIEVIDSGDKNNSQNLLKVTLKENASGTWATSRPLTLNITNRVKINSVAIKSTNFSSDIDGVFVNNSKDVDAGRGTINVSDTKLILKDHTIRDSRMASVEFIFNVTVDEGYEGDIYLTASGGGMDSDGRVKVGEATSITETSVATPIIPDSTPVIPDTTPKTYIVVQIDSNVIKVTAGSLTEEIKMDAPAFIRDGRTMLPLSAVATALGVPATNITWDNEQRQATVLKGNSSVSVKIDSKELIVNDLIMNMSTEAIIVNNRTFLPVAELAMALGVEYTWEPSTMSVVFEN